MQGHREAVKTFNLFRYRIYWYGICVHPEDEHILLILRKASKPYRRCHHKKHAHQTETQPTRGSQGR